MGLAEFLSGSSGERIGSKLIQAVGESGSLLAASWGPLSYFGGWTHSYHVVLSSSNEQCRVQSFLLWESL